MADENTEKKETKPEPIKEESKSRTIKDLSTTDINMQNMMIKQVTDNKIPQEGKTKALKETPNLPEEKKQTTFVASPDFLGNEKEKLAAEALAIKK